MRVTAALLTYPLAAIGAVIAPRAGSVPSGPWTAGVWRMPREGDVFFAGTAINASSGKFWINRETTSYCPGGIEGLDCSAYPGSQTVFAEGNNTLSLNVAVPGGQQVYIAPDGALSYTQPHSGAMPNGSVTTGFYRERSESFGAPVYVYNAGRSWYICPVGEGEPREKVYQVFVGTSPEECYATSVRMYGSDGSNTWEYV